VTKLSRFSFFDRFLFIPLIILFAPYIIKAKPPTPKTANSAGDAPPHAAIKTMNASSAANITPKTTTKTTNPFCLAPSSLSFVPVEAAIPLDFAKVVGEDALSVFETTNSFSNDAKAQLTEVIRTDKKANFINKEKHFILV
jgi:hypothetical protein